jgi:hypothetical protein
MQEDPSMFVRSHLSATLALIASSSLIACDKASSPSETAAEEVSSRELAGEPASVGSTPYHFKTNGPRAFLSAGSVQGTVYQDIWLQVSATGTDQALLDYSFWECSLTTFECVAKEVGFGLVSGDELITGHDRITVNTNTAENPAFERWEGSGGPINITWTQLSGWSYRFSMQSRYRDANSSSHSHGTFTTTPAVAEGTLVGVQIDPGSGYADMGTVKQGEIFIDRLR